MSDASTVPEDADDVGAGGGAARGAPKGPWTAAESRLLVAAVHEWHADASAVARYRGALPGSSRRTCCWHSVSRLFTRASGGQRSSGSAMARFYHLLAVGQATLPASWLSQVAANAAYYSAAAASPAPAAAAAAAAAPGAARARPPPPPRAAAAPASAAAPAAAPAGGAAAPAAAAASAAGAGRKRDREEALGGQAKAAWSEAEAAHLQSLLDRFPRHGEPRTEPATPTNERNCAFWARIAACLQQDGAEGRGRTGYAAYKQAKRMRTPRS